MASEPRVAARKGGGRALAGGGTLTIQPNHDKVATEQLSSLIRALIKTIMPNKKDDLLRTKSDGASFLDKKTCLH